MSRKLSSLGFAVRVLAGCALVACGGGDDAESPGGAGGTAGTVAAGGSGGGGGTTGGTGGTVTATGGTGGSMVTAACAVPAATASCYVMGITGLCDEYYDAGAAMSTKPSCDALRGMFNAGPCPKVVVATQPMIGYCKSRSQTKYYYGGSASSLQSICMNNGSTWCPPL